MPGDWNTRPGGMSVKRSCCSFAVSRTTALHYYQLLSVTRSFRVGLFASSKGPDFLGVMLLHSAYSGLHPLSDCRIQSLFF